MPSPKNPNRRVSLFFPHDLGIMKKTNYLIISRKGSGDKLLLYDNLVSFSGWERIKGRVKIIQKPVHPRQQNLGKIKQVLGGRYQ